MRIALYSALLLLSIYSCNNSEQSKPDLEEQGNESEIQFEKSKWSIMDGVDFPYREQMLNDLIHNDTVRLLDEYEILNLLGKPTRSSDGYLYYMVAQKRLGEWPLHTKSLVIKFSNDSTMEWMKIHE